MKIAVYPGSFDPLTNGHYRVLERALSVFDEVVMLVAENPSKKSFFSAKERVEMIKEATKGLKGVKVDSTRGLTIDYCRKVGSHHIIRGLRAVTDFEYEFQLSAANEFIDDDVDMIFFMARREDNFISSSSVMEMASQGVDVSPLVPECVAKKIKEKGLAG